MPDIVLRTLCRYCHFNVNTNQSLLLPPFARMFKLGEVTGGIERLGPWDAIWETCLLVPLSGSMGSLS